MSCTTRKSRFDSALRTLFEFGSDRKGFSPIMYMPLIAPASAFFMISTTVRPACGSSLASHAFSNFRRTSSAVTAW